MSFANIDPPLEILSKKHSFLILKEETSPFRRYFYISNSMARTLQIVIEPEVEGRIRLDIHPIEEIDDEFHLIIHDKITNISTSLEYALVVSKLKIEEFF